MRNRGIEHEERKKEEIEIEPRELWKREKVMKGNEKEDNKDERKKEEIGSEPSEL